VRWPTTPYHRLGLKLHRSDLPSISSATRSNHRLPVRLQNHPRIGERRQVLLDLIADAGETGMVRRGEDAVAPVDFRPPPKRADHAAEPATLAPPHGILLPTYADSRRDRGDGLWGAYTNGGQL